MITHEQMEDAHGVLHAIHAVPDFAPPVVLYVVFYQTRYYVIRQGWRPYTRPQNFFSRHAREDLALRAALRRARRYEAAYAVDRSRGRFVERR